MIKFINWILCSFGAAIPTCICWHVPFRLSWRRTCSYIDRTKWRHWTNLHFMVVYSEEDARLCILTGVSLHALLVGIRFQNTGFLTTWQRITKQGICWCLCVNYYVKILCIYGIINTCRLNFKFYIICIKLGTFLLYPQKIRAINTDECSEFWMTHRRKWRQWCKVYQQ